MTDCVSTSAKDESSSLCSKEFNNLIDELPSLDALSFEHELCSSRSCLCHNRKHLPQSGNSLGLTAFGVPPSDRPVLAQKPASCNGPATAVTDHLSSLPLAQPTFQSLMVGCPASAALDTDAVSVPHSQDRVFGCQDSQNDASTMQSFAQLCRPTTSDGANSGIPLSFDHGHRNCQLPKDPAYSSHEINLSELQSVLLTTAEESLPVSDCPVHQRTNSVERFPSCTCAQQASRLDDCTSDELAAYFDNFCYIPKNMSPMAEMMYM